MTNRLIMEGGSRGANSKYLQIKAREAVHRFLESCDFKGRQPAVDLMGGRDNAYKTFKTRHANAPAGSYVALWVDSEDPVTDLEKPWEHLKKRDMWDRPEGATDGQALLMATCMESWIISDRPTLRSHYGTKLKENKLPALADLERRERHDVQNLLCAATEECTNAYAKGKLSFEIFAELLPAELAQYLPSFRRFKRILDTKL